MAITVSVHSTMFNSFWDMCLLPNSSNGKKFTLRRMQFPITEAFSITDYKSQGQAYQSAILNLSVEPKMQLQPIFSTAII
ncbi:hypothetical protein BC833DRAFT_626062 [Globomyces pollinis-pini]|nr:hypothetical protein BC833DRAFT_626062 [Globomyces pollinis-pini]